MKNTKFLWKFYALALICFLFAFGASAQVQTARYITTNPRSNAFYEYLPQGYNPAGSETYPLIVFFHGLGEVGPGTSASLPLVLRNGPPKLISQGTFPTSFTVNGVTSKFIVISPQFTDWPGPSDIHTLLNYIIQNYKVDQTRVYLTGLSMGGGVTWDYPGSNPTYANRIAAIVPVCGALWPDQGWAETIAGANIGVWATHNNGDGTVPVTYTNDFITKINAAPTPPSPLAKKTIFTSNSHDAWTQTYNLNFKENNLNVFEWMLTHQRVIAYNPPPIVNAGPDLTTITLPTNSVRYTATASDPGGTISIIRWTKVSGPSAGLIENPTGLWTNIINLVQGTYVFRLSVTDNGGALTTDDVTVVVNGSGSANQAPVANAGSDKSITLPTNTTTLSGSGTDADGSISAYAWSKISGPSATIASPSTASTSLNNLTEGAYIFRLTVTDNGGLSNSDDVNVTVTAATPIPVPTPGSGKPIKVNIYGGSNPFSNTQWNNWNTSSSLSSSNFLYEDQTASSVNATITANGGMSDNGTTYAANATVVPPQVLRYNSYNTSNRTLTIRGLNPATQYSFQFFGSRANTGNKTVFQIGSASYTLNTDNNINDVAVFTNITPDNSGTVTVEMSRIGTYNYLAGFIISEGSVSSNQSPLTNAGGDITITLPVNTATLTGSGSDPDGSISAYAWTKVSGPSAGTITSPGTASTGLTGLVQGVYVFRLTVTDNAGATKSDDITVTVNAATANNLPVANAGADKTITLPSNSVTLAGSGTDTDGTIATYAWTKVSGPSGGSISSPAAASTSVTALTEGSYVFRLTVTDNGGATGSNDVQVTVMPAPVQPAGRSIKVNVFGGTNPYTNTQWNNWNTASSLSSSNFQYEDQTASTVNATITANGGMSDNGAGYASSTTVVPSEILRYNSFNTSNRTLTVNGLNPSMSYSIQFFASRANTGNKTVFQIGNAKDTISTDSNVNDYAGFVAISPDNTGKLTIELSRIGTYNYLAGFIISEETAVRSIMSTPPVTSSAAITDESGDPVLKYLYNVEVFPNPVQTSLTVTTTIPQENQSILFSLIDAQGRVVYQKQAIATQKTENTQIDMSAMKQGVYTLNVKVAGKNLSKQVIKQ